MPIILLYINSSLYFSDRRKAWKKVSSFAKKFVIASNNSELSKQLVFCGMIHFVKHVFDYNQSLQPGKHYNLKLSINIYTILAIFVMFIKKNCLVKA